MRNPKIPETMTLDSIVSEMERRGIVVLTHRPTRWGYVVDAVIPSARVVILKMPELIKQAKVELSMFRDMTDRLESDGYRILIVPKASMNEEQVKAFCDRISAEPALAAA